ncbi:MAG: hypothetical protein IID15_07595, partial [Candidatus Marinimicrobia bacterium]|nr:hypothetical protein [Candidatus Neomarinimicrobiota bacterium]
MRIQILILLIAFTGTLQAGGDGPMGAIDTSIPLVRGWLASGAVPVDTLVAGADSILIDTAHPSYRYPGRAMLLSFLVPGLGQVYIRKPLKGALFIGVDVVAYYIWQNYNAQGDAQIDFFRAFADTTWNFRRWWNNAANFGGPGWDKVHIGRDGSHTLDFIVLDMDGDGRIEYSGTTGDTDGRLEAFLNSPDTAAYVQVRKTGEYYENIGKYNQFFSGWSDADPLNPDVEVTASGAIAWSPHRKLYVGLRGEANRLKSLAGY